MTHSALPPFSTQVTDARYACLDMEPREAGTLTVSCAGFERCLPDYRVERPGYGSFVWEFVAEGAGTLRIGGEEIRLRPGHFFTYGPGVPHLIVSDSRRPLRKYFVDFFGREAVELMTRLELAPPCRGLIADAESLRNLLEELLRDAGGEGALRHEIAAGYLRLLLLKSAERPRSGDNGSPRSYATLQRALHVIEHRHTSLSSLRELAAAARVDPAHLCRLFARFRGDTPQRCLTRRKLDTAARLLSTSPLLVKDAASAAGFADQLHFSRLFKGAFGCSPTEFQRRRAASLNISRA